MTKTILSALLILLVKFSFSQEITELTTTVPGIYYGESKWIDVNNDNIYEYVLAGNSNSSPFTALASYNGSEFVLDTSNIFTQVTNASLDTADFNGDGFMDFIVTGYNGSTEKTYIYLNDGTGHFIEQETSMIGITFGKVRVADLNNDNKPDVVITGTANSTYHAKLYFQNAQGDFVDSQVSLMANYFGEITFLDANNDNQLDILLTGFDTSYAPNAKLYINNNGNFSEAAEQSIHPYYFTATDVADIDNDGDDDLILNGFNSTYNAETSLFFNDGNGSFTKNSTISNTLDQVYFGDINFVDYNNDGFLDIFSIGQNSNNEYISKLYINDGSNNFSLNTDVTNAIIGAGIGSSDWVDFDNDGDLDLILVGIGDDSSEVGMPYRNETESLSITDNSIETISIYPNPAKDYLTIKSYVNIKTIDVTSILGETVLNKVGLTNNTLNVKELNIGMYLLYITDINGQKQVFKFLKN